MDARVWLNGRLVDAHEAHVPFLTPALHYGAAVFEGIRCYAGENGPAVFRLAEHVRRLVDSAHIFGFDHLPYTEAELAAAIKETVRASGFDRCYIRPLIYLAEGGWDLSLDSGVPHVGIAVWRWDAYLGEEARARGIRANTSSFTRHHPNVMMTKAKISGNYANSVLARTESRRLGFDEAILLDPQGYVAECTGENLFVVRGQKLVTTPVAPILEGITRDSVLALARDVEIDVTEAVLSRDMLYAADEVFVCGTAAELIGVSEIDGRRIGAGVTGPVTRQLQDLFHAATGGQHRFSAEWLDPVYEPRPAAL